MSRTNIVCLWARMGGIGMEYGTIKIKLDELIQKDGISKNRLSHRAEMQRTQLNNYCNNKITRLDIDVLARICTVLHCEIGELLEFIPPKDGYDTSELTHSPEKE